MAEEYPENADYITKLLECLSFPVRLMIICSLVEGEKNVGNFSAKIPTTKGNISQHLKILEKNNILKRRRAGNKIFYSISNKKIVKLIKEIKKICKEKP